MSLGGSDVSIGGVRILRAPNKALISWEKLIRGLAANASGAK